MATRLVWEMPIIPKWINQQKLNMKKHLLLSAAVATTLSATVSAETKTYFNSELGEVFGVADNGRFAAVSDIENNIAYLWDSQNPEVFYDISFDVETTITLPSAQRVKGTLAYDVTDDGRIVVGSLLYADGHQSPAYRIDGDWVPLPVLANSLNTNTAIAVTPDGKTIAGYNYVKSDYADVPGGYIPVSWVMEDGDYVMAEVIEQADVLKYEHQGFYPMSMSADGKTICGELYCGSSSVIPALVKDGELKIFNEITSKIEGWYVEGKGWYCGWNEEKTAQIWTEDPDDPRIIKYKEWYVDGYHDTSESHVVGFFSNCDANRYYYGARVVIKDVDEEGNGTIDNYATIYDSVEDRWLDNDRYTAFAAGVGENLIFANGAVVLVNGKARPVEEEYAIESPSPVAGISKISANGKVLGGVRSEYNEGTGEYQYFPFVTVVDGAFSGVGNVYGGNEAVSIVVSKGNVTVFNADFMEVYDLGGILRGTGKSVDLAPGCYVVKAGDRTSRILVK